MLSYIEDNVIDINIALEEKANMLEIPKEEMDFNIISSNLLSIDQKYKASYKIEFFQKENKMTLGSIIDIQFDEQNNPKKAYAVVNTRNFTDEMDISNKCIINIIKKKLALSNIIVGVKENLFEAIAEEIRKRLISKSPPFKILIAEEIKPQNGENSKLKYHFKLFNKTGTLKTKNVINYKEKNLLAPVKKGALLLEYYKPTLGKEGYSIFGDIIPQVEGQNIKNIDLQFSSNDVDIVEDQFSIKYFSKKDGTLVYKNGTYSIDEIINIAKVDITTTGDINGDINANISVGGTKSNVIEDVVGQGMKIIGKNVTINGDVGSNAIIEAETVKINGNLHPNALVKAKNVYVAKCRGIVEANEVEVDLAEHALITSKEKVIATKVLASNIIATNIEIKGALLSANIITSSKEVIINNILGDGNTISIRPLDLPWINNEYSTLIARKDALNVILSEKRKQIDNIKEKLLNEFTNYRTILNLVTEKKKKRENIPKSLLMKLQNYKDIGKLSKEQESELSQFNQQYGDLIKKIDEIKYSYRKSHVIINGTLEKGNKFVFDDILSKIVEQTEKSVKAYVRRVKDIESIVIEKL